MKIDKVLLVIMLSLVSWLYINRIDKMEAVQTLQLNHYDSIVLIDRIYVGASLRTNCKFPAYTRLTFHAKLTDGQIQAVSVCMGIWGEPKIQILSN
jgi:hypothetical protein